MAFRFSTPLIYSLNEHIYYLLPKQLSGNNMSSAALRLAIDLTQVAKIPKQKVHFSYSNNGDPTGRAMTQNMTLPSKTIFG